ncbi:UBL3 protein, partial [Polypterus senegalus]|nr:UBL3 protein [Polypterus senegalus]
MDWEEEQVSSPNILRLIYQGRFLHGNVTLGALKLPLGKTTVMHLVARETLPEPNSQGNFSQYFIESVGCTVLMSKNSSFASKANLRVHSSPINHIFIPFINYYKIIIGIVSLEKLDAFCFFSLFKHIHF